MDQVTEAYAFRIGGLANGSGWDANWFWVDLLNKSPLYSYCGRSFARLIKLRDQIEKLSNEYLKQSSESEVLTHASMLQYGLTIHIITGQQPFASHSPLLSLITAH